MRAGRWRVGVVATSLVASTAVAMTGRPAIAGPSGGALPPPVVQVLRVTGRYGVPADVSMVAANVTAVSPLAAGYVTVYACDAEPPDTSNVNFFADQVVPNLVLSRVSTDGTICIATSAVTDVIVDLVGYVPTGASVRPLDVPVRRLDTRDPGGPSSPVAAGSVTEIAVAGRDGIPTDATVVMFNATAIAGTSPGYLTAYPCGGLPDTSSVNYQPGQIVPNLVTSRVSADSTICIYNLSAADFIIDLAAYATDGIVPLTTPRRLVDTRDDGNAKPDRTTLRLDIRGRTDVPDDATAAIYNLTSVDATAPGYVTSYPCDVGRPKVSNLNYAPGNVTANGTITKLSADGELCLFRLRPTNLIVDLIGYTRDDTHYVPVTPKRILDTRNRWRQTCVWILTGEASSPQLRATRLDVTRQIVIERSSPRPEVPPFIDGCRGVGWAEDVPGGGWVVRFRDFSLVQRPPIEIPAGARVPYADVTILADGRVAGVRKSDGAIVDLATAEIIASPPWLGSVVSASIVPSGIVAVRERGELGGAPFIETYDIASGGRVGSFIAQDTVNTVELSPDGRYLALDNGVAGAGTSMMVVTPNGTWIDDMGSPGPVYQRIIPRFDGRGTVLACIQDVGLQRLDLFGEQRVVAEWNQPQMFSTSTGRECEEQFWR